MPETRLKQWRRGCLVTTSNQSIAARQRTQRTASLKVAMGRVDTVAGHMAHARERAGFFRTIAEFKSLPPGPTEPMR